MSGAGQPVTAEELSVGDAGPTIYVADVSTRDFVQYAGASGDFNPIHYDSEYARGAGYDSVFGQGMLTAGFASRLATDWFGVAAVRRFRVRFESRVLPGDSLTVTGTVREIEREGERATVNADITVVTQDDRTVLTGNVTATMPTER